MSKARKTTNPYYYKDVAKELNVHHLFGRYGVEFGRKIDPSGKKYGWKVVHIIPLDGWSFDPHEITEALANDPAFSISYTKRLDRAAILEAIASLEVKSLPSDDPELRYWQGYTQAQLDITNKVEQL